MTLPIVPRPLVDLPRWRFVGPPRGGRVVAVAGDPREAMTFWMGACSGGVFKTTDGGRYWLPMTDGWFGSPSVGAIAVADSDPNVVWVGTGEGAVRNNVVPGDGVYRTTDGGRTWDHLGLAATRHIPRVRVHPLDPDVAYVAAIGDIFGPNPERGVYRTTDGGRGWELVLHVDERTGAADLAMDPNNPRILFAAMWEAERKPWTMRSGGEGSGLYRSTDGGDSWELVSGKPGFAEGILGRMGVSVSPARSGRVFALVEAAEGQGGLYRSDDLGATWEQVSDHRGIQGRPWYYSHVVADPVHADTVYSMNLWAWRSTDGGRNWTQFQTPHGDNHGLWIDPRDPRRMINGNDGGACVSFNAGVSWSSIYNQPTAQLYRFDVDPRFPHDLYATQQDNSGIRVPSRSWKGAIRWDDCQELGEAESGDVALDPTDPTTVFLGGAGFGHPGPLLRFDRVTEQPADVAVWPEYFMGVGASEQRHRFGWTFPIEFSPHDPTVLYIGGERVFRSTDRGMSWEAISPDLTRDDPDKQRPSGGPISLDTSGAEIYCTIHAFAESPLTPGELWAGSDDGLVHVSVDGGASWRDVTPPELPAWSTVQRIEVSRHTPGTAYLAAHAYRVQDRRPLLFVTRDHGGRWERITAGIPEDEWTRTIREDTVASEVLYAGTERGPWMSRDGGSSWTSIAGNLPAVPIYDLRLLGHELIVATHGRGFWILDDVTPLREEPAELEDEALLLHELPPVYRYPTPNGFDMPGEGVWNGGFFGVPLGGASFTPVRQLDGSTENLVIEGGTNPPNGATLYYHLGSRLADDGAELTLTVRDEAGRELCVLSDSEDEAGPPRPTLPRRSGLNRFTWDLRTTPAASVPSSEGTRSAVVAGPRVPPGRYLLELRCGAAIATSRLEVRRDPRGYATDEDLVTQFRYLTRVRDLVAVIHDQLELLRGLRSAVSRVVGLDDAGLVAGAEDLLGELDRLEAILTQPDMLDHGDALKMPAGLDQKLVLLTEIVVELSDTAPNQGAWQVLERFERQVLTAVEELERVRTERVDALVAALRGADDATLLPLPALREEATLATVRAEPLA
ncbi:MAG: glycosyl hydrolase [Nitriliruptoraceae bacterium]